jgi:hypothetical protein
MLVRLTVAIANDQPKSRNLPESVLLETRLVPAAAPMPGDTRDGHDGHEHYSESHRRHDASV